MPELVTSYQCPACTAPLRFDGGSGKLVCDYCGGAFDPKEMEARYARKDADAAAAMAAQQAQGTENAGSAWEFAQAGADWAQDAGSMAAYRCAHCGAQLLCESTAAATSCPYCGNNAIIPGKLDGARRPECVIPFASEKQAAVDALHKHFQGKLLLPKSFTADSHLQEIKGLYVPFWLFDGEADGEMEFEATRSRSYRQGDYRVTETHHFRCRRAGSLGFENIPADASKKMPDDYMDSLEPYDYGGMKPFSAAYMPGFLADQYDVSAEECAPRADERAQESVADALRATVTGYEGCMERSRSLRLRQGRARCALLPVWLLRTEWRGKTYLFTMNGQTGKMVGDLPASPGRAAALFALVYALGAAVAAALTYFAF